MKLAQGRVQRRALEFDILNRGAELQEIQHVNSLKG